MYFWVMNLARLDIPIRNSSRTSSKNKHTHRCPAYFFLSSFILLCLLGSIACGQTVYQLEPFTNNGGYYNSSDLNLYVEVSSSMAGEADFTFHNESLLESCIANIYFDSGPLLGTAAITDGDGTSFTQPTAPKNLPGANLLEPRFVADDEFSYEAEPPKTKNGVNPGEWLRINFELNGTFAELTDELNSGITRIGVHVTNLPDGSSESAIAGPEPATAAMLGLGCLVLFGTCRRIRKRL